MRRVLPFLLGGLGVVVFAVAGWALAAALDGEEAASVAAPPPVEEPGATLQLPVLGLLEGDLDEATLDEQAAVVLEAPPEGVDPAALAVDPDDVADGSDVPVPTRRDVVEAASVHGGDRVATVAEPRRTELPGDAAAREGWGRLDGSDTVPEEGGDDAAAAAAADLDGLGVVETTEAGDPLPLPEDPDDRVIDLCAGPEPVEGCPDGVGGTVSLAVVGPFDIIEVVAGADDRCGIASGRDRYVATIRSSAPGRFGIRSIPRPGGDEGVETVTVETAPEERARWEADESIVVQTCVAFPFGATDRTFEVQVLGAGLEDGEVDGWHGRITPLPNDRPSVQFRGITGTPGRNDAMALVTSRPDEEVEILRLAREPGQTTSACNRIDELIAADHRGIHRERPSSLGLPLPPGPPDFPRVHVFELRRMATTVNDVCVTWYRDLAPDREVVERQAWAVLPPQLPSVSLHLSELTQASGASADLQGAALWLSDRGGRELCYLWVPAPDGGEVCRLDTTSHAEVVTLHVRGSFDGPPAGEQRHALELQQQRCSDTTCGGWVRLSLAGPDGSPGGSVRLAVRYTNPGTEHTIPVALFAGDPAGWNAAPMGTFGGDAERATARAEVPRLDLTGTTIHYDQAEDPFAITVRWTADRPVSALVEAGAPSGQSCRSGRAPGLVPLVRAEPTGLATSGEATFEACPGVTHHFAIRLSTPDGGLATFASGGLDIGEHVGYAHETAYDWPDGNLTTPPLPVDVTYGARLRMADWTGYVYVPPTDRQPRSSHVDWWTELAGQRFSQSRRSGIIVHNSPTCAGLADFDVAPATVTPTPIRVDAGPRLPIRVDAGYSFYGACRLIQTPEGAPTATGGLVMIESVPLYDALHAAPVTVTKRGTPSNRPATSGCNLCVPHLFADVSATVAPRG